MTKAPLRLPFALERLKEAWHFHRFGDGVDEDALTVRIGYGNLYSVLRRWRSRSELQDMAVESRRSLRRTQFELQRPTLWTGFAFEGLEHLKAAAAAGRGALIVSFHVGPYRFIPLELAHAGYTVDTVVDQDGTNRESGLLDHFRKWIKGVALDGSGRYAYWRAGLLERLGVINAEKADCAIRIAQALRSGHLVMIYLDGNTGAGAKRAEHLQEVVFFGTSILVRAGVGEISKVTGAPVVLALTWRRPFRRHLCRFYPPILPGTDEGRSQYSRRVLSELISRFEARLAPSPGQWEEWHHVHRMQNAPEGEPQRDAWKMTPDRANGSRYTVDTYRAYPVEKDESHFVFEPERRRFVTVSRFDFEVLSALRRPRSADELVELFAGAHGRDAVLLEMDRLRSRGWVEARS